MMSTPEHRVRLYPGYVRSSLIWPIYLGTISFGISGALAAGRRRMDFGGVVVLGAIVAVGGGTIRDVLLYRTVFWIDDPAFLAVGAISALVTIPLFRIASTELKRAYWLVESFDAIGLALFVVAGTNIAIDAGANDIAAITIGIISGIGVGIIRDVLANEIPTVLTDGRLYFTAALARALLYLLLWRSPSAGLYGWLLPRGSAWLIRISRGSSQTGNTQRRSRPDSATDRSQ